MVLGATNMFSMVSPGYFFLPSLHVYVYYCEFSGRKGNMIIVLQHVSCVWIYSEVMNGRSKEY